MKFQAYWSIQYHMNQINFFFAFNFKLDVIIRRWFGFASIFASIKIFDTIFDHIKYMSVWTLVTLPLKSTETHIQLFSPEGIREPEINYINEIIVGDKKPECSTSLNSILPHYFFLIWLSQPTSGISLYIYIVMEQ